MVDMGSPQPGIPRHLDPQDGYLRREAKQMKRESSPPRGPGSMADPMKGREAMVPTVKEGGRSIHLIPREELRQPGKEGIIAQVGGHHNTLELHSRRTLAWGES